MYHFLAMVVYVICQIKLLESIFSWIKIAVQYVRVISIKLLFAKITAAKIVKLCPD